MNTLEDTLVAALTETAAEIPAGNLPPLRLPARPARGRARWPRRRSGSRSWAWLAAPVTAAAAVAGVTVLSVALTAQGGPGQPPGALASGGPALPPRYAALVWHPGPDGGASILSSLVIRDTATGRTLATVDPPGPDNSFCDLAGAPGGRTFVAEACTGWVAGGGQTPHVTQPKLYRFTVDDQGQVSALTPLDISPPDPNDLDALAVSPDGSKLAVASADHRGEFGRDPVIGLYSLDTGQLLRSWAWDGQASIMGRAGGTGSMSFTADGATLEFPLSVGEQFDGQVRLLDTTAPGSSLREARLVLDLGPTPSELVAAGPQGPDSMITPDGSRIVASSATVSGHPASTRLAVSEYSAASGAPAAELDPVTLRGTLVLYRPVLWSSPDGSTLITVGVPADGVPSNGVLPIGVLASGHFTALPGSMAEVLQIAF